MVNLTSLSVDVLQVTLVFEMQMPWHKHVLLHKFLLAYAFLSLPFLLKCPHVDKPLASYSCDASELIDSAMPQGFVGEVVDNCDRDEGVTGLFPQR